jgi:hypothetical protein
MDKVGASREIDETVKKLEVEVRMLTNQNRQLETSLQKV